MSFKNRFMSFFSDTEQKAVRIKNSQVIENLGQISLVLADKTGTLTEGKMKMRKILIDTIEWDIFVFHRTAKNGFMKDEGTTDAQQSEDLSSGEQSNKFS